MVLNFDRSIYYNNNNKKKEYKSKQATYVQLKSGVVYGVLPC